MRLPRLFVPLCLLVMAAGTSGAAAQSEIAGPLVAFAEDGACRLEVHGNGKIFLIAATGMDAGESGRYLVANGNMMPIDWNVTASADGRFARYYMPFRFGRQGDTVTVSFATGRCHVSTTFGWRRGIRVID
ncbi:MAG: hypothetical protein KGM49_15120 [Sphingomonadales bacterium]|nr:hypothetical protein [Sphingomonadales bacterium]